MTLWVALWYSVVITQSRRITKADLLQIGESVGGTDARTVLSTGNMIFASDETRDQLEQRLEAETERHLGKKIPVFCRTAAEWTTLVAENPFPIETKDNPARVAVRVMRNMPSQEVLDRIEAAASPDEKFAVTPGGLWLATKEQISGGRLLAAIGSTWAGEGTFRSASSIAKVAAALP